MRNNIKSLVIAGIIFLFFGILSVIYTEKILPFGSMIYTIIVVFCFILSMIFLSISASILGKGDYLSLSDLIPGQEYILVEHVSVDGKKIFSLVGKPDSENFVSVQNEELSKLNPKDHFVIVKKQIRRIL